MRQRNASGKSNARKRERKREREEKEPRDNCTRKNGKRTRTETVCLSLSLSRSLFFPFEEKKKMREKRSSRNEVEQRSTTQTCLSPLRFSRVSLSRGEPRESPSCVFVFALHVLPARSSFAYSLQTAHR